MRKSLFNYIASHPPRILVRVLNGYLPRRRNRRILMLPPFLRVGILRSSVLARPNRFFRGSILDLCQISIFSPINCRVLRLHAPITAGVLRLHALITTRVSFPVWQSIQIWLGRMGLLSFQVPTLCHWETCLQSPQLENPLRGPVAPVVCLIFTIGPTVARAQGVLLAFGWDM
jgi:hypothetical protein